MISVDDALEIVTALGDRLANKRPDIADSNSPYVLLAAWAKLV